MNRTDIINAFAGRRGYRDYLEIGGGGDGWNIDRVDCERKFALNPPSDRPAADRRVASDDFFRDCSARFDVIFIDGHHEEEQVARDIRNALAHLHPGGVVLLHDCLPPDEWHQRPYEDFRPGEDWNGAVWKSALRYFASSPWACYVVDCDWGCGVIDTASPRRTAPVALPGRLEYGEHFPLLRPFVRGEAEFLAELYGVAVFYHVAGMGDWQRVVQEHFDLLAAVGLPRLSISHVGSPDGLAYLDRAAAERGLRAEVAAHRDDLRAFESPAMQAIERWARDSDGSVLYFHTKGVSAPGCAHKRKWRELMGRETIGRWKENVRELDRHDVVGINWRNCPPIAHFSGNFWWARGTGFARSPPSTITTGTRSIPATGATAAASVASSGSAPPPAAPA